MSYTQVRNRPLVVEEERINFEDDIETRAERHAPATRDRGVLG